MTTEPCIYKTKTLNSQDVTVNPPYTHPKERSNSKYYSFHRKHYPPPNSTRSRNPNSLVLTQIKFKSQFEFAPRATTESEFLDLVDSGGKAFLVENVVTDCTGWRRPIGCLIFKGLVPQKSLINSDLFYGKWLATKASYGSSPSCTNSSKWYQRSHRSRSRSYIDRLVGCVYVYKILSAVSSLLDG